MYNTYMNLEYYMKQAIREAEASVEEGNPPFAVVVVDKGGNIIFQDHDRVRELKDPTAHGEINAIRKLCKVNNTLSLEDYTFFTTSEPCPTCLTAMIKAHVHVCYYGAKTEKNASLPLSAEYIAGLSKVHPITVTGGILEEECLTQRQKYRKA